MQTVYPHNLSTYQQCVYLIILPQCMWLCSHSSYMWRRCRLWFFRFLVQLPIRLRRRLVLVRYVLCRRKAIESVLSLSFAIIAWLGYPQRVLLLHNPQSKKQLPRVVRGSCGFVYTSLCSSRVTSIVCLSPSR
jgi:hypothetical protein